MARNPPPDRFDPLKMNYEGIWNTKDAKETRKLRKAFSRLSCLFVTFAL